jgi:hypothetical protein
MTQSLTSLRQNVFIDGKAVALILNACAAYHQQDVRDLAASARSVDDSLSGVWNMDEDEQDRGNDGEFASSDAPEVLMSTQIWLSKNCYLLFGAQIYQKEMKP